jgi:hypothetical protein
MLDWMAFNNELLSTHRLRNLASTGGVAAYAGGDETKTPRPSSSAVPRPPPLMSRCFEGYSGPAFWPS